MAPAKRIAIIGNYGAGNLGDECILEAIVDSHPQCEFTVFAGHPHKVNAENANLTDKAHLFPLGLRSWLRGKLFSSIRSLRQSDQVILGGGGLFQDMYRLAPFIWGWQFLWCRMFGKPVFIYGTSVGPLNSYFGKKITRWVYNKAAGVTVRDTRSKEILIQLGIPAEKIQVTSDPVFLLNDRDTDQVSKNSFLISLRPIPQNQDQLLETMDQLIPFIENELNGEVKFVQMQKATFEDDITIFDELRKKHHHISVITPNSTAELEFLMNRAQMAIGMRLHFLLFALKKNVPTIALKYGHKIQDMFQKLGLDERLVETSEVNFEELKAHVLHVLENKNEIRQHIFQSVEKEKEAAQKNFELFESFLMSS